MLKIQARHFHQGRLRTVTLACVHDMEWAERPTTAEDCAHMFATMDREASAHVCIDNNSIVRCVNDGDTAWAAPRANANGLHAEFAGFARQSRADWLDDYGKAMLKIGAKQFAVWCDKYDLPVVRLTPAEIRAGKKGLCGHLDVTHAYPGSGDHSDPGDHFPWDVFLPMVKEELAKLRNPLPAKPVAWSRTLVYTKGKKFLSGSDVTEWQKRMKALGYAIDVDGQYGPQTAAATRAFQTAATLLVTGAVDRTTWDAAGDKLAAKK